MKPAMPLAETLFDAISSSSLKCAKQLIAGGADLDAVNEHNRTALMEATLAGEVEIAYVLMKAGADLNHQDSEGCTAAHLAERKYRPSKYDPSEEDCRGFWFLLELYSRGAKPFRNKQGCTPLMCMRDKIAGMRLTERQSQALFVYEARFYSLHKEEAYAQCFLTSYATLSYAQRFYSWQFSDYVFAQSGGFGSPWLPDSERHVSQEIIDYFAGIFKYQRFFVAVRVSNTEAFREMLPDMKSWLNDWSRSPELLKACIFSEYSGNRQFKALRFLVEKGFDRFRYWGSSGGDDVSILASVFINTLLPADVVKKMVHLFLFHGADPAYDFKAEAYVRSLVTSEMREHPEIAAFVRAVDPVFKAVNTPDKTNILDLALRQVMLPENQALMAKALALNTTLQSGDKDLSFKALVGRLKQKKLSFFASNRLHRLVMLAKNQVLRRPRSLTLTEAEKKKVNGLMKMLCMAEKKVDLYQAMANTAGMGFQEEIAVTDFQRVWRDHWARKSLFQSDESKEVSSSEVQVVEAAF